MNGPGFRGLGAAVAAGVLATGCVLKEPPPPNELLAQAMPAIQVPAQWAGAASGAGDVAAGWLDLFPDPVLKQLVTEAMAHNPDLAVAAARVEAAEASARAAGASLYPQVNLAGRGGGKLSGDNSGLQGLGLFANWEIDLWGRVRAQSGAAQAKYESVALDTRYARESIAALVAKSWFLAREATLQRKIATDMVASAESLASLARDRVRVGRGDEFEAAQAEANVFTYRDLVLQTDIARQNALRAVEILVGRYPSGALEAGPDLPAPPGAIPVGLPSQLLERRPDVRAAERRVAAAFYAIQEAQAARLPRIALSASGSTVSSELLVLKERDNPVWGIGATLTFPIFNAGALQAQVEVRTAEQKAAVADYGRIGSRAFGEVEGALSTGFNLEGRADALARAGEASERALGFARKRFEVGSADQRAVQQQMLAFYAVRTSLVRVQSERLIQRVNLHLALGGGFEPASP